MATSQATIQLVFMRKLIRSPKYDGEIVYQQRSDGPKSDVLKINGSGVELQLSRRNRIKPEKAINSVTLRSLRTSYLYVAATTGNAQPAREVKVSASSGGQASYDRESNSPSLPLFDWGFESYKGYDKKLLMPRSVAEEMFQQTQTAKAARRSVSFLLAAMQAPDNTDRLRHLWSAFNPLYQLYYLLTRGKVEIHDNICLNHLSEHIRSGKLVLERAESMLENIDEVEIANGINWGFMKIDSEKKSDGKKGGRNIVPVYIMTRQRFLEEAPQHTRMSFLLIRYLYFCRNKIVHGNVSYPVFSVQKSEEDIGELLDLLTLALFDMIERCAAIEREQGTALFP